MKMFSCCSAVIVWALLMGLTSCTSLSSPPLIYPAHLGLETTLETLLERPGEYDIYFSARSFNPSGILFVPHGSPYTVLPEKQGLGRGWNRVEDSSQLPKMIAIIRERDYLSHPALKALVRPLPGRQKATSKDVLGYLFGSKSTFAKVLSDKVMTYKVYEIPEIPRMGDTNEDGMLWRGMHH